MPRARVFVPRERVPAVLANLLLLYAAGAEGLRLVSEIAAMTSDLRPVLAARDDLAQVEELLDQLDWSATEVRGPVELHGDADLITTALFGGLS